MGAGGQCRERVLEQPELHGGERQKGRGRRRCLQEEVPPVRGLDRTLRLRFRQVLELGACAFGPDGRQAPLGVGFLCPVSFCEAPVWTWSSWCSASSCRQTALCLQPGRESWQRGLSLMSLALYRLQ